MAIAEVFGKKIEEIHEKNPEKAQKFLKLGWEGQELLFALRPNKALCKSNRYLAKMMMETMLKPLQDPDHSVMVSIFMPCELMALAGLHPYNVEGFSCYLNGSHAERMCLQKAEEEGIAETLCSYHRTFLGAAWGGLLPKPKCIVYTNMTCDANMLTFKTLADFYQVPCFYVDVPVRQSEEAVRYVASELRNLKIFLEKQTGRKIDEDLLKQRAAESRHQMEMYREFQKKRASRYIPEDLVSPFYAAMANNILAGTPEAGRYLRMLLAETDGQPAARGKKIYWMHSIPFWSEALRDCFYLKESAQIVGCDLAELAYPSEAKDPYIAMAGRMVYSAINGPVKRRIEKGIEHAKEAGADGVVWFNHWGCKHTMAGAQMAKREFEAAGLPLLILDGDGVDRRHGGEGQTATRLGAFLEML